jgi:hypothetical protein
MILVASGTITFEFYHSPAFVSALGLLDVDGNESVRLTVSSVFFVEKERDGGISLLDCFCLTNSFIFV